MAALDHGLSWNLNISVTWQVNIIPAEKGQFSSIAAL